MIKAKVTKNIMAKTALNIGGLPITPKQLIAAIFSLAIGIGEYFLLKNWSMNAKMSVIFLTMFVLISATVITINGVPLHKFLFMGFKGVDKRPFHSNKENF